MNTAASPKPADLPTILAVFGVRDYGPCDGGQGSATCPHCGAQGRYVISFLCDDGTRRGAMKGCFNLFRQANTTVSKLVQQAFDRQQDAQEKGTKLASWWTEICEVAQTFERDGTVENYQQWVNTIHTINNRRVAWLNRNGYGRFGRRR